MANEKTIRFCLLTFSIQVQHNYYNCDHYRNQSTCSSFSTTHTTVRLIRNTITCTPCSFYIFIEFIQVRSKKRISWWNRIFILLPILTLTISLTANCNVCYLNYGFNYNKTCWFLFLLFLFICCICNDFVV